MFDRLTKGILIAIAALLMVIAAELSRNGRGLLATAAAQIPDPGRQRQEHLLELKKTNQLLRQILEHVQTKAIKVAVVDTKDEASRLGELGGP